MKRCTWFVLAGSLLVVLSIIAGGCITIVTPEPSAPTSSTPADSFPPTNEPEQEGSEPAINSFIANPHNINSDASSTLSWNISGATAVNIDQGIGTVGLSGTIVVSPTTTTTYTLTASNAAGTAVVTTQVVVSAVSPPPIPASLPIVHSFVADPESIVAGGSSTLSWSVSNAYSVIIAPVVYRQLGPIPATGSVPISPSVTTTYTLTATNASGIRNETVTVTVNSEPVASPALDWAGTWETNWGIMHLSQSAGQVTGTYEHDDGKIVGYISKNLSGNILIGTWSESPSYAPPNDAGDIEWVMSPDFNSLEGNWRYGSSGEWDGTWTGTRLD